MNTFTRMGEAMLLAEEGHKQIGHVLLDALARGATRVGRLFRRPHDASPPRD